MTEPKLCACRQLSANVSGALDNPDAFPDSIKSFGLELQECPELSMSSEVPMATLDALAEVSDIVERVQGIENSDESIAH